MHANGVPRRLPSRLALFGAGIAAIVVMCSLASTAPAAHAGTAQACAPAWSPTSIYTRGAAVSANGTGYIANYWTRGDDPATNNGPRRSGEPWTAQGACLSGGGGGAGGTGAGGTGAGSTEGGATKPPGTGSDLLFGPYKDISMSLNWNTGVLGTSAATGSRIPLVGSGSLTSDYLPNLSSVSLAFATGECGREAWVGVPGQTFANANIAALSSAGLPYVISTGGAGGTFTCASPANFGAFLARYMSPQMVGVDFDIEMGQSAAQVAKLVAAAAYGQTLYPNLRFSFTIATLAASDGSYAGVNALGDAVVRSIKSSSLTNYTINLMAMNYGNVSKYVCVVSKGRCDMAQSAIQAVANLQRTYGIPASKIELTAMIGMNDVTSEVVTVDEAATIARYAVSEGLAGVHYWSLDRDAPCVSAVASPVCNSVPTSTRLQYTTAMLTALGR